MNNNAKPGITVIISLFGIWSDGQTERSAICWLAPQSPDKAVPCWNQESIWQIQQLCKIGNTSFEVRISLDSPCFVHLTLFLKKWRNHRNAFWGRWTKSGKLKKRHFCFHLVCRDGAATLPCAWLHCSLGWGMISWYNPPVQEHGAYDMGKGYFDWQVGRLCHMGQECSGFQFKVLQMLANSLSHFILWDFWPLK